jgi:hypothetical protein
MLRRGQWWRWWSTSWRRWWLLPWREKEETSKELAPTWIEVAPMTYFSHMLINFPKYTVRLRAEMRSCWRELFFSILPKNQDREWVLRTIRDALRNHFYPSFLVRGRHQAATLWAHLQSVNSRWPRLPLIWIRLEKFRTAKSQVLRVADAAPVLGFWGPSGKLVATAPLDHKTYNI